MTNRDLDRRVEGILSVESRLSMDVVKLVNHVHLIVLGFVALLLHLYVLVFISI